MSQWSRTLVLACFLLAACGGSTNSTSGTTGTGGGDSTGGVNGSGGESGAGTGGTGGVIVGAGGRSTGGVTSGGAAGVAVTREPLKHRSTATPCDVPGGPAPPPPLPGDASVPPGQCNIDADCRAGVNGRCVLGRGSFCTYDTCFSDKDCTADELCECGGPARLSNVCLSSGCRVDADCPGSWCSPTFGTCGNFSGVIGYQCHTRADVCTDDSDCGVGAPGMPYCMYDQMVGHWLCSTSQCVG